MKNKVLLFLLSILIVIECLIFYTRFNMHTKKSNKEGVSYMEYTDSIPKNYFNEIPNGGRVEKVNYDTYDYTKKDKPKITKPAYVYLPYGYDKNNTDKKYNVFFFIHGWTGTAEEYFDYENEAMKKVLDNMINDKLIDPLIVVSLTWDSEDKAQDWMRSTDEIAVYHQEFRNDLLPFIDKTYNTKKNRDSRAFGGFSLGGVTTWHEFENDLDLIKYFVPMSGDSWIEEMFGGRDAPQKTAEKLKEIADKSGKDFLICQTNGTNDAVFEQPDNQMKAIFKLTDTFNHGNLIYLMKKGGYHNFDATMEATYNALTRIFK